MEPVMHEATAVGVQREQRNTQISSRATATVIRLWICNANAVIVQISSRATAAV